MFHILYFFISSYIVLFMYYFISYFCPILSYFCPIFCTIFVESYTGPFLFLYRSYFVLYRSYLSYTGPIFLVHFLDFSRFFPIFPDFSRFFHFSLMQSAGYLQLNATLYMLRNKENIA